MKKSIAVLLLLLLCMACTVGLAEGERIFDKADLFTPDEEELIYSWIEYFQSENGMDFVVLTTDYPNSEGNQQEIADQFFLDGDFGFGDEASGILYYIDIDDRYHYIATHGEMIDYMTDERIESAIEECTPLLADADYAGAVVQMINIVDDDVSAGIPEGQFRYDVITGEVLTARHKALTSGEIIVCALIGLAVCLIFVAAVQRSYKLKGSTYEYDYSEQASVDLTLSKDTYLRTTTTRTRKPDPPQQSDGDSSSSGGSSVHSSGGSSFGGGGGHF